MQFRNFAENLLGSKVKIKLLKYIVSEGAITSEREIGRLIGVSPGAVNRTLKEFHELNLITPMRIGNVTAWQLNEKSYAYGYIKEFFSNLKIKEEPFDDLQDRIKNLFRICGTDTKIAKVILFGSIAEGRELPGSDIDLFILVRNEKDRKDVLEGIDEMSRFCLQEYGNKLSPNIFTPDDMKNQKNKKFLENVMKGIRVIDR